MPHAYTEDQLVEQPAIGLFAELGWTTVSALEETFGAPSPGLSATLSHPMGEGASLGRETKGEVVLVSRLRAALERLNPALPPEAITAAVSGKLRVSPHGESRDLSETPTVNGGSGLNEWPIARCCKPLIASRLLFE